MACWYAENATNAFLGIMKMGKGIEDQNGVEFISAMAAGNNVQLMVVACSGAADSTTLALVAASLQTGGRIICIPPNKSELHSSKKYLGIYAQHVEFVIGDAKNLLLNKYKEADFIAIDYNLGNHEEIITAMQENREKHKNAIVVGYNALHKETWRNGSLRTQFLPIGEGLLITRIAASRMNNNKSNWVVKVDKCTGEEHVFRVRSSVGSRFIKA